jgi:hypothetical protein
MSEEKTTVRSYGAGFGTPNDPVKWYPEEGKFMTEREYQTCKKTPPGMYPPWHVTDVTTSTPIVTTGVTGTYAPIKSSIESPFQAMERRSRERDERIRLEVVEEKRKEQMEELEKKLERKLELLERKIEAIKKLSIATHDDVAAVLRELLK